MLKVREASDLHLEYYADSLKAGRNVSDYEKVINSFLPPLPSDSETVLILAGDIVNVKRSDILINIFSVLVPRFKHIIYVLGNHEHYHGNIHTTFPIIEDAIHSNITNASDKVTIAGNEPVKVEIDDVTFLAGTLWTDYAGSDALVIHRTIQYYISDHRAITGTGLALLTCKELISIHKATIEQFKKWMVGINSTKTVICTHHLPSFYAVDPQYSKSDDAVTRLINHAFATDLDAFIHTYKPAFWVFGHTHTHFFGRLGDTQLICNPVGYPREGNISKGNYNRHNMFEV